MFFKARGRYYHASEDKDAIRKALESDLRNYQGPITLCSPGETGDSVDYRQSLVRDGKRITGGKVRPVRIKPC